MDKRVLGKSGIDTILDFEFWILGAIGVFA
jgi:hypothetical protein